MIITNIWSTQISTHQWWRYRTAPMMCNWTARDWSDFPVRSWLIQYWSMAETGPMCRPNQIGCDFFEEVNAINLFDWKTMNRHALIIMKGKGKPAVESNSSFPTMASCPSGSLRVPFPCNGAGCWPQRVLVGWIRKHEVLHGSAYYDDICLSLGIDEQYQAFVVCVLLVHSPRERWSTVSFGTCSFLQYLLPGVSNI